MIAVVVVDEVLRQSGHDRVFPGGVVVAFPGNVVLVAGLVADLATADDLINDVVTIWEGLLRIWQIDRSR